jgi:hypothetical protein
VSSGNSRLAQTFTAGSTGELTGAQLEIFKAGVSVGDYIVQIARVNHSGIPTNDVLAAAAIPNAAVPAGVSVLTATFTPGPAVVAGGEYALLITRPGGGGNDLNPRVHANDDCPGAMWVSPDQTGAFNVPDPDPDIVFTVFVQPPPDAAPPQTAITDGPKAKTRKKRATFEFAGTDTRAVAGIAGFECSLDGGAFAACSSPHSVKVRKGEHTFAVRATDGAGNVDGTPAAFDWKVKKKRRK